MCHLISDFDFALTVDCTALSVPGSAVSPIYVSVRDC
jgi:hypothetical protein